MNFMMHVLSNRFHGMPQLSVLWGQNLNFNGRKIQNQNIQNVYNIQNSRNVRNDQMLLMSMFICKEFSNFIQEQMLPKFSLPESQSNIDKQIMLNFPCLGGICQIF